MTVRLTEAQFQAKIVNRAKARGWLVHHARPAPTRSGGWATPIQGNIGFPDLVLAKQGRLVFAEVKTERGTLGEYQQEWLDALDGEGRLVTVWRPADWPTITELLDG